MNLCTKRYNIIKHGKLLQKIKPPKGGSKGVIFMEQNTAAKKKPNKVLVIILVVLIAILLMLIGIISSDDDDATENKSTTTSPVTTEETTEPIDYTVKVPTYFMFDSEYNDWIEQSKSNELITVDNDYVSLLLDKNKYDSLFGLYTTEIEKTIDAIITDKNYSSIKKITYNDDCSEATVIVTSDYLDSDDSVAIRKVGNTLSQIRAMFYKDYSSKIKITMNDENGKKIDTIKYKHPTTRALETTATELISAYSENEVAANNMYEDKYLYITGTIDSIGTDITDTMYVTLTNGDEWSIDRVQCFFNDEYTNEVAALRKGDTVEIYGTCDGYMMNVMIEDCVLWEN